MTPNHVARTARRKLQGTEAIDSPRLLRARCKRPRDRRAADKRDELASLQQLALSFEGYNLACRWADCASQHKRAAHVAYGSKADIAVDLRNGRFTPQSCHRTAG